MALTRALTCTTTGCLALYLGRPLLTPDAVRRYARQAGWDTTEAASPDYCPSCRRGGTPVLERGECPHCMGTCFDRADGAVCHYCGHVVPHPADDQDQGDPEQEPTGERP
nr:hypothetical protein [Streptomyces chartreusis]